jgi:hypothetical protein
MKFLENQISTTQGQPWGPCTLAGMIRRFISYGFYGDGNFFVSYDGAWVSTLLREQEGNLSFLFP